MATLSEFLQVSEFLLDTKTGEQTALALAHQVLVRAEVGNADNKVLSLIHISEPTRPY